MQKLQDLKYLQKRVADSLMKKEQYEDLNDSAEQLVEIKNDEIIRIQSQIKQFNQLMLVDFQKLITEVEEEDDNRDLKQEIQDKYEQREKLRKTNQDLMDKIDLYFNDEWIVGFLIENILNFTN